MSRRWIYGSSYLSCPIEAQDRIADIESIASGTMGLIQQRALCGLITRLQGNYTTNGNDLWSEFLAFGTEFWMLTPLTDAIATADIYRYELFSRLQSGNYFNFLAADIQPDGVTGGSTKYFRTTTLSDAFPQNDVAHGVMVSQRNDTANAVLFGNDNGPNTNQVQYASRNTRTEAFFRVNDGGSALVTGLPSIDTEGLFIVQRDGADKTLHVNSSLIATISGAFQWPTVVSREMGFHSFLRQSSVPLLESSDRLSGYMYGMPSLNAAKHQDLHDALSWYNQNVITGGR